MKSMTKTVAICLGLLGILTVEHSAASEINVKKSLNQSIEHQALQVNTSLDLELQQSIADAINKLMLTNNKFSFKKYQLTESKLNKINTDITTEKAE